MGELLSDDYFIEKLTERDMGLLKKLYHSFKNRTNAKKSELGPEGIKYLKKLAGKFSTAIEKRVGGVKLSQIGDEEEKEVSNERASLSPTKIENLKSSLILLGNKRITKNAGNKKITILTDDFTVNKAIFSGKGRSKKEVNARIKAIPEFEKIIRASKYVESDTNITEIEKSAKKGVIAMHKFEGAYENFQIEILVRDKGKKQFLYEVKFKDKDNKKVPNRVWRTSPPPRLLLEMLRTAQEYHKKTRMSIVLTKESQKIVPMTQKTIRSRPLKRLRAE